MNVIGITQDPDGVDVTYCDANDVNHTVRARFVIGCDGGSSFVRGAIGVAFEGQSFAQKWLVVDCQNEGNGMREMQFFCDPRRPALTLPVSKGRRRWEFLVMPSDDPDYLVSEASIRRLIAGYAPQDKSTIERALIYTFHARYAARFQVGRVLLAGDAAHVSPPFAGQGLNSGFRDANNLAWRLDLVWRGLSDRAVLESYETERLPHVKALTQFLVKLGQAIMPITPFKAAVRDAIFASQHVVPGLRSHIDRGGPIPRPRLAKGAVRGKHNSSGHMLVQPRIANGGGQLDDVIGKGWAVIGLDIDPRAALHGQDAALCDSLGASFSRFDSAEMPALARQIGSGRIVLVRPDRYVADILPRASNNSQLSWLAASLKLISQDENTMDADPHLARAQNPVAKAQDLAFVMFARPDLDLAEKFMLDFGLKTIERTSERLVMRATQGLGPAYVAIQASKAAFIGHALRVKNSDELIALSKVEGTSKSERLDLPGGGVHLRMRDPAGFEVWAVADQQALPAMPTRAPILMNNPLTQPRVNATIRPIASPATILRPGHCVLGTTEFLATARWYMDTFGLIPSDIQTLKDGSPALAFLRCDRGSDPADHHTIVVSQNVTNTYSHSAFEVIDLDDVATGQEHLLGQKWTHAWGIGRHILGSQIFDYWRDPWGDKVEHFTDGDVFEASVPTGFSLLTSASLYQWGPNVPSDFEKPKMTPAFLWKALGNIRRSPELTFAKVRQLLSAIDAPARPWTK
jgi:FAD binding domain/Glyoxalase/Bleomycin resistance protein/Dioxygenase superfamily